jgi:hypothetical protein
MFSFVTILTGLRFDISSISYIQNRELHGVNDVLNPRIPVSHIHQGDRRRSQRYVSLEQLAG